VENPCYSRSRKSFPFLCYCICIHNIQLCTCLDSGWSRGNMLSGCFDCAQAHTSTFKIEFDAENENLKKLIRHTWA
jgi:hypothetical protein